MNIGKLIEVDVRDLWKHEQYDFSEWLSKDENIEELNKILGLNLVDVSKEIPVGSYRCDLIAKDETSNTTVIIENQLEATNHDHLGKIITYASGLDANVIVWIVAEAREEHSSAIEWLNNHTDENISFFLIELHAYKIGDSIPAPKFEVIEQPNGFMKSTKVSRASSELSKSKSERLEFWSTFNNRLVARGRPFNVRKATTDNWYNVSVGTSEAHISITLVNKDNFIGVELFITDNKALFDRLYEQKEKINSELELKLEWRRLDDKQRSRIIHKIKGLDFDDHSNYEKLIDETIDKVIKFKNVFTKYL